MTELIHPSRHIRDSVRELAGDIDPAGIELMALTRTVANHLEALEDEALREVGLSGARWHLLGRLMGEERHGDSRGVTPSHLSRCQNVSRNTMSALLAGLEEQGLVERELDALDRRVFRFRLTDAGRALIEATARQHVAFMARLTAGLSDDERAMLARLLEKLHESLVQERASCG